MSLENRSPSESGSRPSATEYRAPKLIAYGSLAHLTTAGAGSQSEMAMMTNLMMFP